MIDKEISILVEDCFSTSKRKEVGWPEVLVPQLLEQWAERVKLIIYALENTSEGSILEIGTEFGDFTSMYLILMEKLGIFRNLITIDPYETNSFIYLFMVNKLARISLELYNKKMGDERIWRHYLIPDTLFMYEIYPLLPPNETKYCFALLDGPHDAPSALKEVDFFSNKIVMNGVMLIDDFSKDSPVWDALTNLGWETGKFSNHIYGRRTV